MTYELLSLERMATSRQNMSTSDLQPNEEARYLSNSKGIFKLRDTPNENSGVNKYVNGDEY